MNERIIVSMTSYPKRIHNVGFAIYLLLCKQTLPPDEIHLWLSIEEFPNKERSLPNDLQSMLQHPKVKIHWLPVNTYVHKRHEIFKYTTDNDCVFLIDDDVMYSSDLIEHVMSVHTKCNDCIICYNQYAKHEYKGFHILYGAPGKETEPKANWNRWCGQSMIPSKLYPKDILDDDHQNVRNMCSPICDESWFQPWLVWYNIPIFHLSYNWGIDIDPKNGKNLGLCSSTHIIESNGLEKRDNWLYEVLTHYNKILNKYKELFKYGIQL